MVKYLILFFSLVFAVSGQMLLKKGSLTLGEIVKSPKGIIDLGLSMLKNLNILGSLAMFGVAFVLWTWVLSKMQLNVAYPIAVTVQLMLLVIGSWFLNSVLKCNFFRRKLRHAEKTHKEVVSAPHPSR